MTTACPEDRVNLIRVELESESDDLIIKIKKDVDHLGYIDATSTPSLYS